MLEACTQPSFFIHVCSFQCAIKYILLSQSLSFIYRSFYDAVQAFIDMVEVCQYQRAKTGSVMYYYFSTRILCMLICTFYIYFDMSKL